MNSTVHSSFRFSSDRLSHAYIADGDIVDSLAMAAVCSAQGCEKPCLICSHCDKAARHIHPDIIPVDKLDDKREIIVDQIRELKRDVLVVPNEADKKVYIIHNADSMNTSSQNAFLQMLEEPPSHTVFILKTDNPATLLRTVRSRCVELRSATIPEDDELFLHHSTNVTPCVESDSNSETLDLSEELANAFITALSSGNSALAGFMFRLDKIDKHAFSAFLTSARKQIASSFRCKDSLPCAVMDELLAQAEHILVEAGEMLDRNVSTGHISGMICASLMTVDT